MGVYRYATSRMIDHSEHPNLSNVMVDRRAIIIADKGHVRFLNGGKLISDSLGGKLVWVSGEPFAVS